MAEDPDPARHSPSASGVFWGLLLGEWALLGLAWLIDHESPSHPFQAEHLAWSPTIAGWGLLATLPAAAFAIVASSETGQRWGPLRSIYDKLEGGLGRELRSWSHWQYALLSLGAGVGEEFLFRGVVQPHWGLGTAALIFGLLHALTPAYFFLAFAMGAYLGWLYHATESLWVPICVHALYDLIALELMSRRLGPPDGDVPAPVDELPLATEPAIPGENRSPLEEPPPRKRSPEPHSPEERPPDPEDDRPADRQGELPEDEAVGPI